MTMAEENKMFIVGGIAFCDVESAKTAQNELKRIELLDEKMDYGDVESVAVVYDKARQNHVFKTPIGLSYMMRLQNCLVQNQYPGISEMPIVVQTTYGNRKEEEQEAAGQEHGNELWKARLEKSKEETKKQKEKLRLSIGLNALLAVLVIALFIISQTGNNPTILNYRSKIINQYARWQQQLEEREQVIEQKEAELGIK